MLILLCACRNVPNQTHGYHNNDNDDQQLQVSGAVMDLEMSWDKSIATVAAGDTVHFFNTG